MERQLARSGGGIEPHLRTDRIDQTPWLLCLQPYDPILLPFTSQLGLDHTILPRDFDWLSGAEERQIAGHCTSSPPESEKSEFAKYSSLAWFYEQRF